MLHEILLSLSGHPSPLLRTHTPEAYSLAGITPPERQLLAWAAHLSDVHIKLIAHTAQIAASHPSTICRAVAAAIDSIHLSAFQQKVLQVEESILKDDPALVGAYNIVPLTAVMAEFRQWTRRMDWLWDTVQFMAADGKGSDVCQGSQLMNRLREELQSGYDDVRETAMSLVTVAETSWLKQISAWILYGRLPMFGEDDFFVSRGSDEDFVCKPELLPSFVTPASTSSMMFIGKSLNHIRAQSRVDSGLRGLDQLSSKLQELASLKFPLDSAAFSRTIKAIRTSLSENTLQKILPLGRVVETLQLLRDFFLLGRGEFAMALTQEADERVRNRWRRADNLAYEKADALKNLVVKDGEIAAVLGRTWAVLASMQGQHSDEDEQLELARDLLRLHLTKSNPSTPLNLAPGLGPDSTELRAALHFQSLLFSVPTSLSMHLPSPLDMVFSPSDLQLYSCINSYLLSMRRAHNRLTDLWKITSLRRLHPSVRGADEQATQLRQRWAARSSMLRGAWTTASAAIFLLGETEAYLQTEVVAGLWDGFYAWLTGHDRREQRQDGSSRVASSTSQPGKKKDGEDEDDDDLWLRDAVSSDPAATGHGSIRRTSRPAHDPQSLAIAHALYLRTLIHRLLLTQSTFTEQLYALLIHIDHLVAHMQRLHSIFTSIDLETDAGVVDAFVDLEKEEAEVKALLYSVEGKVRRGIEEVVAALRALEGDVGFAAAWEGEGPASEDDDGTDAGDAGAGYAPARVGGLNRLLMKLDFGSWFGGGDEWQR